MNSWPTFTFYYQCLNGSYFNVWWENYKEFVIKAKLGGWSQGSKKIILGLLCKNFLKQIYTYNKGIRTTRNPFRLGRKYLGCGTKMGSNACNDSYLNK